MNPTIPLRKLPDLSIKIFLVGLALALGMVASARAQNLLSNGDFESGRTSWAIFIPKESEGADCDFEVVKEGPRGGEQCVELRGTSPVRWAISSYVKKNLMPSPGERLRVSAWVKAGKDFQSVPGTPGFAIRVSMFSAEQGPDGQLRGAQNGLVYVGINKVVQNVNHAPLNDQTIPEEWTKVEGVFETSPDLDSMNVSLIIVKGTGTFYFDDVVLEHVDESVPLSDFSN